MKKKTITKKTTKKTTKAKPKKATKPAPSFPQMERKAAALNKRVQRGERLYYEICGGAHSFVAYKGDESYFTVNRRGLIVRPKLTERNIERYDSIDRIVPLKVRSFPKPIYEKGK